MLYELEEAIFHCDKGLKNNFNFNYILSRQDVSQCAYNHSANK